MAAIQSGKYARLELERRFLIRELPDNLLKQLQGWQIQDHYLPATRLRLRRMTALRGDEVLLKLGQKYRDDSLDPMETMITNLYLNAEEYQCLRTLSARELCKTRYRYPFKDREFGIDVFEGPLADLILAEVECDSAKELMQIPFPAFAALEVTGDPFFLGGNLVRLSREEFESGFAERLTAK